MPLDPTTSDWLTVGSAATSLLALMVALLALRRARRSAGRTPASPPRRSSVVARTPPRAALAGSADIRDEVAALRGEVAHALRHLAFVRYDAFGDMGGQLSWSLALLDDAGNGTVLTSIHGRSDSRTYAKSIRGWSCEQQLSAEEVEAIDFARTDRLR